MFLQFLGFWSCERKKKREKRKEKREKEEPAEEITRQVFVVARNLVVLVPFFLPTSRTCAGCWSLPALPLARSLALTWRQGSSSRPLYGR
jgi:hypothetical protein